MQHPPRFSQLGDDIRCVRCDNPSPLTGPGTNTFLVGRREIAVIDPGPDDARHCLDILDAVPSGAQITKILVTHSHLDHSPNARALAAATGAPVLAYGADGTGRSAIMEELAQTSELGGGEGRDTIFAPTQHVLDGEEIAHDGAALIAHWTPGHYGNHLTFQWGDVGFSGDLVMAWATTLVSPPDGDVSAFLRSCERLQQLNLSAVLPAHGDRIETPNDRLCELISHRKAREAQVLQTLQRGPATAKTLTRAIYTEVPEHLWPAAERNVLAHLIDLYDRKVVVAADQFGAAAKFMLR